MSKKFRKKVKYYYPDGDEFEGAFHWFLFNWFLAPLVIWIFYPLFYLFRPNERGRREVYWEEIKVAKRSKKE